MMLIATSWDDGLVTDLRLVNILDKYSASASFAINSRLHGRIPVLNDVRSGSVFGYKLTRLDLLALYPYDICNHLPYHEQINVVDDSRVLGIIEDGKKDLEDMFGREVPGIVWPYGVSTVLSNESARLAGHLYGRDAINNQPGIDRWNIRPIDWRVDPEDIIDRGCDVVLFGHTYELAGECDWDYLDEIYRIYSSDHRCELVNMSQLMVSYD